jgi:hypothetical protein
MKRKISIQLKAAFLMIVFSLNTIIGFACAVGMDMGFNTSNHHDEEATEISVHVHADGKKHIHHGATKHHNKPDNDHKSKGGKDNCCHEKVIQFAQLDKTVPQSPGVMNPIFFITFASAFYNSEILFPSQVTPNIKYFVRSYHPPISDIRIAIHSFRI